MLKYNVCFLILVFLARPVLGARVAVILKLADSYAMFQQDMLRGMQFALTESNYSNLTMKSFSHDGDQASIEKAVVMAKKFNPDIVIAGETSQFAMTISREFLDKVFITPTASSVKLSEIHPQPIRMIHSDDQYVDIIKKLLNKESLGKIGVFHNLSFPNTNRISSKAIEFFKSKKIDIEIVSYLAGEEITEKKLEPFIKNKIDTLIFFSFESDLRKVFTVLKNKEIFPLYIGADSWGRDDFLRENLLTQNSSFKGIRSIYWNPDRRDANFISLKKKMEKSFGKNIDAFHAIGYDTLTVIIDVLKKNPSVKEFHNTIKGLKFENMLTSKSISFNSVFYPVKDMYLFSLDKEGIRFHSSLVPE